MEGRTRYIFTAEGFDPVIFHLTREQEDLLRILARYDYLREEFDYHPITEQQEFTP